MKTRHKAAPTNRIRTTTGEHTEEVRDEIIHWLRDAYALERGLESALEKQANSDELSPEIKARAARHLEETRHHADEVKAALQSLDANTSVLKTSLGIMAQATKGIASAFARDERIKDLLDAYSMEHFEIACYTALAAAANRAGYPQVVEACRRILPDEKRMAQALLNSLPSEVAAFLFETETETAAK